MVMRANVCLRRLSGGERPQEVGFGRFLANPKVTVERLIAGWSDQTAVAVAGRHVLAIQDTSEISFHTTTERRRGLGEIGKGGRPRGLLLHAMLALDAEAGSCLGLAGGQIWNRRGRVQSDCHARRFEAKESHRWVATAEQAKQTLAAAARVTVVADRESDIFAVWARLPAPDFHLIIRVMQDRRLADGGKLYDAVAAFPFCATRVIALPERGREKARSAKLGLRFGPVELAPPKNSAEPDLPDRVALNCLEIVELDPPKGVEPVHWRLLTTHPLPDPKADHPKADHPKTDHPRAAWQVVDWYKMRWTIEQFWRLLKRQGLKLEESQVETAERLLKLTAIAAKAAVLTMQLLQARDGRSRETASAAFAPDELALLEKLDAKYKGRTVLQQNPHPKTSLAWAAWLVARLGGWDGYPSSKPPGPITFKHGLDQFRAMANAWQLFDVCIP
jgi:hypothetical protein